MSNALVYPDDGDNFRRILYLNGVESIPMSKQLKKQSRSVTSET